MTEKKAKTVQNITLGCDPEMFLKDKDGKYISSIGLVGGSKDKPKPISEKGHAIQEDNVSVEFNIPPCSTADDFVKEISFVKDYINDTIAKPKGLLLACVSSALFSGDQLLADAALIFGCDPDLNAWTGATNEVNREGVDPSLRVCGGHIHIGYDNPTKETSMKIIQAMDLFLAIPSVLLDKDTRRRQLYGKAGAFRFKKFGVEHRTLSNFWVDSPELIKWAFESTMKAIEFVNIGGIVTNEDQIIKAINNCDVELAKQIMDDYHIDLPSFAEQQEETTSGRELN